MTFDLVAARALIARIRDRSIHVQTQTLDELVVMLDQAICAIRSTEGQIGQLQSALRGVKEQAEGRSVHARKLEEQAQAMRTSAIESERGAADRLALILESAAETLETSAATVAKLKAQRSASEAQAAAARSSYEKALATLTAERCASEERTAHLTNLLDRIAAMPWWEALRHAAASAREDR